MSSGDFGTIWRAIGSHAVWTLLIVSLGLNLLQNQRLQGTAHAREQLPLPGTRLPAIDVVSAGAQEMRLEYNAQSLPTILYYFSPSCGWCERNWNSVSALERATRGRYRFVAVTTAGETARRDRASRLPVPTYWGLSESQRLAHEFAGTPHTVAVSPDGRVLQSWSGAYVRNVRVDVERYFQVQLPEVKLPASAH
jgi:hypothetical protein